MKIERQKALRLAAQKWIAKWLRRLIDFADDRLHAWEVRIREELAVGSRQPILGAASVSGRGAARPRAHELAAIRAGGNGGAEIVPVAASAAAVSLDPKPTNRRRMSFAEWEMRRSGVLLDGGASAWRSSRKPRAVRDASCAPVQHRRRSGTAAEFDRRFV